MPKKNNDQFLAELLDVWGNEFEPLEPYKGYDKHIPFFHRICKKVIYKTPKNLLTQRYYCRHCKAKENGKKQRKTTEWFESQLLKYYGDEYEVKGEYITSKEEVSVYHKSLKKTIKKTLKKTILANIFARAEFNFKLFS